MVDIIEMKERVAATEAKLKAANAEGEQRSQRLLSLLEAVEKNFSRNQKEIRALREERAAAIDEIQQLRNLLQVMLSLAETSKTSDPGLPHGEMESLIQRLNEIAASATRDLNEAAGEMETQDPSTASADEQVDPPAAKTESKQKKKPRRKGLSKIFTFLAALSWIAAAGLITEKIQADSMTEALEAALARSHSAHHALSLEVERVSADLGAARTQLSRYRNSKAQTAANP